MLTHIKRSIRRNAPARTAAPQRVLWPEKVIGGKVSMDRAMFIHGDTATARIVAQAEKAARGPANILIEGAPGTGKAALAQFIHAHAGGRSEFLAVHCDANDETVIDMVTQAHCSITVFLHEVAQLSGAAQARLVMALRSEASAQIIAASSCSIAEAVAEGAFREDLFYRLGVVTLRLPPLASRPADILALAQHFASRVAQSHGLPGRELEADAMSKLAAYHWPGNVRELENVIHRAVLFADGETIRARDIILSAGRPNEEDPVSAALVGRTVAEVERDLILQTLRHCGGNRTQAAEILGISVRTLRNKIRQYHEEGSEVPAYSRAA